MQTSTPHLMIRKRMQFIQGKTRPCCQVQAFVGEDLKAALEEHFLGEVLFKRASYSMNWPKGAIEIPAALAPHMSVLLKNDACPEITVKTMLAGQLYQGTSISDMMSFELIAKLAFDNLVSICETVSEFEQDIVYTGRKNADQMAFEADAAADGAAVLQDEAA